MSVSFYFANGFKSFYIIVFEAVNFDTQNLPDVFVGMKFYLPSSLPNRDQLYRYIIAYDGEVVPDYEKDSASHIVVKTKEVLFYLLNVVEIFFC